MNIKINSVLVLLALTMGCATSRERVPLREEQMARLQKAACPPATLGVGLTENSDGSILLEHANVFSGSDQTALPFYSRPFQKIRVPLVRLSVNGHDTYALIDTGASTTLMDYWGAKRVGLVPFGPSLIRHKIYSLSGTTELFLGLADTLAFGDITLHKAPIGILNDARDAASYLWIDGFRTEVILGHDLLSLFSYVSIDFKHERIVLGRKGHYKPDPKKWLGETPLITRFGVPVMLTYLEGQPAHVAFDTGMDLGLLLPCLLAHQLKVPELAQTLHIRMAESLSGEAVYMPIRDRTLHLLDMDFKNVPTIVNMIQADQGDPPYALLGTQFLKKYVITFDYLAKKIIFERP